MPTFHIVWLLCNLSLGGKLCLRDDKNTAFISSPSLAIAGEHGKRHETCAHKQEGVSDWLKPHSLGDHVTAILNVEVFCTALVI